MDDSEDSPESHNRYCHSQGPTLHSPVILRVGVTKDAPTLPHAGLHVLSYQKARCQQHRLMEKFLLYNIFFFASKYARVYLRGESRVIAIFGFYFSMLSGIRQNRSAVPARDRHLC